ncbi:MAG: hypothetical protein NTY38_03625 [Acidobacteria bacterium]|nr:hypothetical protein [Acidobacteriota bacterium]
MTGASSTIFTSHTYFFANLPLFAVISIVLVLGRRRQLTRLALKSGLACLPCSVLAPIHEGYWLPVRLGGSSIGIEDLIFTFTTGAVVWLCAAWPYRRELRVPSRLSAGGLVKRILLWGLLSDLVLAALWLGGLDPMSATLLAAVPLLAILLARRRHLWAFACAGLACFVPFYFAAVRLQFAIFPDYSRQWNSEGPWAAQLLEVPLGEIAWAAAFAVLWPVVIASAFEVKCRPAGATPESSGL